MNSIASILINEVDPAKKNALWMNSCLSSMRVYWRPLKNVIQGRTGRAIMYSVQPLPEIANSFDDEDFKKNVKFIPIPVLEPLVNVLVEDIVRNPPRAEVKAEDPTAVNEKKSDIEKLKYRGILERDRSELQSRIGFGPYKVPYDEFNGNVEEFDKLGLSENDPDDVNFYEQNYQRLWYEIGAQNLLNNIIKTNQFDKTTIRRLIKDVFWSKCVCTQAYVDQLTGEIKYKYIDPQICFGIWGDANDGKDDVCRGWQDNITVQEFMQMVGNEFNWDRDWKQLLWGLNFFNNFKYTGFIRGGITYDCYGDGEWMGRIGCDGVESSSLIDFTQAYMFKVSVGYSEFRTMEATSTKLRNKNNPDWFEYVDYQYQLSKRKIKEGYDKESKYQQQWYSCYFLATSAISQYIYKFQKVYYQHIEGANDEYSNGTLCYYQEEGRSAVDIAAPYLQLVNFCHYRMLWIIYKAKPDPDEYIWEELTQLAGTFKKEFPQAGTNQIAPKVGDIINNIIKEFRQKHVRIRTYPRIDGKPVAQISPIEKSGQGGLDPLAIAMQAIEAWAEQQIAAKIGINPMRIGANPPSRESTQSENATIAASYATTGYFYRMVQYLKEHLAISSLNYATDIIQYPDTMPYKWIERIVGNESFEALKVLGKVSAHRFGIYIEDYNFEVDRQRLQQAADIALSQKTLTMAQWAIIVQTQNPKLGFKILAHLELKAKKKERRQALEDQQIVLEQQKQIHAMKMEELTFTRETAYGVADIEAKALVESARVQAEGRIQVKQLQNEAETPKQMNRTQGEIEVAQAKADAENQKAITA